ncbi:hypothetical protein [Rathayibacter sp. AY1D1]|uniref:hypothetical protein n=1 Tax=Rathayibacter sp. AY1D1 TaxID=2080542 RepID=UPI0011AFF896|nr:hypothetical protein [Rathayibacter sp. AY1D1]
MTEPRWRTLVRSSTPLLPDAEVWTRQAEGWACSRILTPVPQLFTDALPYTYSTTLVQGREAPKLVPIEAAPEDLGELRPWQAQLGELTKAA